MIVGAMRTPDGLWRVEAVRKGRQNWYRILRAGELYADLLSIAAVERILREDAGVDIATLVPVP